MILRPVYLCLHHRRHRRDLPNRYQLCRYLCHYRRHLYLCPVLCHRRHRRRRKLLQRCRL
jgi:hypothetical protein